MEVKVVDGEWARVLTNTQNTTATYPAGMGRTYAFRVRVTDRLSNTSAWVEGVARTVQVRVGLAFIVADRTGASLSIAACRAPG